LLNILGRRVPRSLRIFFVNDQGEAQPPAK
jgi:hypothetical protein